MTRKWMTWAAWMVLPVSMVAQEWQLVWADEFGGDQLNAAKWSYMIGDGTEYGIPGWGNNELQYYREENVKVAGGLLTITAKKEAFGGRQYTSGRIRTKGKGDWTYARIEFSARMPVGGGLWAAVWMLPTNELYGGWAASGEIDIMEYLGQDTGIVHGTLHFGGTSPANVSKGGSFTLEGASFGEAFHDFAMEWEDGIFRWYVDGELYQSFSSGWYSTLAPFPAPFDRSFHLLVNLAVGGNWPGEPNWTTEFPQELVLDYIRVYQRGSTGLEENQAIRAGQRKGQNYPNPFSTGTVIPYEVTGKEQHIRLELFDGLGRKVRTLLDGLHRPGSFTYTLDGSPLPPGLYFYRINVNGSEQVYRMSRL